MFSKRWPDLFRTLSFQLTIWYAGIFAFSSFLVLSVFYFRVSTITTQRTDQDLMEEINEYAAILTHKGVQAVKKEMLLESELESGRVFFRLLAPDGKEIVSTDMRRWHDIKALEIDLSGLREGTGPVFRTLDIPSRQYKMRTVYARIGPQVIMQIGQSLEDNEKYLEVFRNLMVSLMTPLFILAALIGWFMARKALTGVEEVTRTAVTITNGAYEKRVQVKSKTTEIDRLANTFNRMLDRIQTLLRAMREMTDNIAHDLRNPLARIRGIAEMTLLSKKSIDDYREMAVNTIEECDNLIDMINTMLDITETEAGVGDIYIEDVDLCRLILDACELFRPVAEKKSIKIHTAVPDRIFIRGDKRRMQRMVTNLLENAIKYTPSGGSVHIGAAMDDGGVHITVEDTGIGIPEKEQSRIFERFYRCDRSRTQPGLGLGLSLAKAIAEAFGGCITVKSAVNRGSVFTVTMPV